MPLEISWWIDGGVILSFNVFFFFNLFSFPFISILNKLTPEKFDKLCLELLNVGVDSKLVLKGSILLVSIVFNCTCVLFL